MLRNQLRVNIQRDSRSGSTHGQAQNSGSGMVLKTEYQSMMPRGSSIRVGLIIVIPTELVIEPTPCCLALNSSPIGPYQPESFTPIGSLLTHEAEIEFLSLDIHTNEPLALRSVRLPSMACMLKCASYLNHFRTYVSMFRTHWFNGCTSSMVSEPKGSTQ